MTQERPEHLNRSQIIIQGSFYTPEKFVELAGRWIKEFIHDSSYIFLDSSCGYGAFLQLHDLFNENRFIGNDIDEHAVSIAATVYPDISFFCQNALTQVSRDAFGISDNDPLIVVGNPPYNDTTSQSGQKIKRGNDIKIDNDIKSRDLGISFLNSYDKLKADYACILHPLSYLIKKANFKSASKFFNNYQIEKIIVFPSSEFANTSKTVSFPVVMALYRRHEGNGVTFDKVKNIVFNTTDGCSFSINCWDYVGDYIRKYPGNIRYDREILFYTLRDVNALKRSRTFITERIANAIDVDPKLLAYYCYIDCFKKYANTPYYLGNFDIPFIKEKFSSISESVMKIAKHNHPEVFGSNDAPTDAEIESVIKYINKVTSLSL
jgi:hypothetical protein